MVILDGLQVAGCLHALVEGGFLGLQDLVTDAILKPSEEELMLDKFEGIRDAFGFSFGDGRAATLTAAMVVGLLSVRRL